MASPYRVLWIDPESIRHQILLEKAPTLLSGSIVAGEWDREVSCFSDSTKYKGLVERFVLGWRWEETILFRTTFVDRLRTHGHLMGMRSLDELVRYYESRIDRLFENIRSGGFAPPSLLRRIHPVNVLIGRDGAFLAGMGGNHRLAIALILELESLPVRVEIRHLQWQNIRESLKRSGPMAIPEEFLGHPDLQDLNSVDRSV